MSIDFIVCFCWFVGGAKYFALEKPLFQILDFYWA